MADSCETPSQKPGSPLFATTRWSLVAAAGGSDAGGAALALEWLCGVYWYPLYAYCRRKGHDAEEAFDLTQDFFALLLDKCSIASADPAKGKFRTFLLTSFERFLVNEWKRERRLKRGGGRMPLSLDAAAAEERYRMGPLVLLTAERIYERCWAMTLLEQTLARLGDECAASGRSPLFEAVKQELSGESSDSTMAEIAGRLGMTATAVKTAVHRLRRRYGELLRAEIAQTVALPGEVDDEIRQLFSAFE